MPDELPTGTVTLLFTDVEGSTRLLNDLGAEAYEEALAEHRRVLREAFAPRGGVEVDTQGDAFFFAFPSAAEAIEGAREGQQARARRRTSAEPLYRSLDAANRTSRGGVAARVANIFAAFNPPGNLRTPKSSALQSHLLLLERRSASDRRKP